MADIIKSATIGAIIGLAAWAVNLFAGSFFGMLGGFAIVGTVAVGYILVEQLDLN